jgi:hypothetical protein
MAVRELDLDTLESARMPGHGNWHLFSTWKRWKSRVGGVFPRKQQRRDNSESNLCS